MLLLLIALLGARPTGDGGEYLLAARALARHETPDVRVSDAEWLGLREPRWRAVSARIVDGMHEQLLTPLPSVRRTPNGSYYSLHFWFYSLLSVPLLWLTEATHLRPMFALVVLNALAASTAVAFMFRRFGETRRALGAALFFLLSGTTFYLGWTGPEVLTGAALLVACMAARDGELGIGIAAGGIAASQNPSAIFVLPFVLGSVWPRRRALGPRERLLVAGGVTLALLPYFFFYYEYRVWSLIARFATDFRLISWERAWSLVFDLNQGMIMGLPGLLVGSLAVAIGAIAACRGRERRVVAASVASTLLLVVCMAVPTFSVHNWNSGNVVFARYGYWLAMPLLELAVALIDRLASRLGIAVAAGAALLQIGALAASGPFGERYSYVRHSWAAKLVLRRLPSAYNPVPEIFYERSLGWEAPVDEADVVVWPYRGEPGKIMVREGRVAESKRICADGRVITSAGIHAGSAGWTYLDAPFRCRTP